MSTKSKTAIGKIYKYIETKDKIVRKILFYLDLCIFMG